MQLNSENTDDSITCCSYPVAHHVMLLGYTILPTSAGLMPTEARGNYLPEADGLKRNSLLPEAPLRLRM